MCITRGNGYRDVMVIISEGAGHCKLEDLSTAPTAPVTGTTWIALALCLAQILLLLTVAGLNKNAWYLLAIGTLGMVQNALAAGVRRDPSTSGIHFKPMRYQHNGQPIVVEERIVFRALQRAEEVESYVGLCLLPIFFPGGLRPDEEKWRDTKFRENKRVYLPYPDSAASPPQLGLTQPSEIEPAHPSQVTRRVPANRTDTSVST